MNVVIMSFDPNEKQSVICARKQYETYRLIKLKISCTRLVKERRKLVSKLCIGRNIIECAWQAQESHETVID